jgi:hypothetical protein
MTKNTTSEGYPLSAPIVSFLKVELVREGGGLRVTNALAYNGTKLITVVKVL